MYDTTANLVFLVKAETCTIAKKICMFAVTQPSLQANTNPKDFLQKFSKNHRKTTF